MADYFLPDELVNLKRLKQEHRHKDKDVKFNDDLLSCYSVLPQSNSLGKISVLIIGDIETGRDRFAMALGERFDKLRIFKTDMLPFETSKLQQKRYDFVVIIVSMSSMNSLFVAQRAITSISELMLNRRCSLVLTNLEQHTTYAFPLNNVKDLVAMYDIPVIACDLQDASSTQAAVTQMMSLSMLSSSSSEVSPILVDCIEREG